MRTWEIRYTNQIKQQKESIPTENWFELFTVHLMGWLRREWSQLIMLIRLANYDNYVMNKRHGYPIPNVISLAAHERTYTSNLHIAAKMEYVST